MLTPVEVEALNLSLRVAVLASLACLPPAVGIAWCCRTRMPGDAAQYCGARAAGAAAGRSYLLLLLFGVRGRRLVPTKCSD
jgi:glycerol uptake facilitator-like aquaporin